MDFRGRLIFLLLLLSVMVLLNSFITLRSIQKREVNNVMLGGRQIKPQVQISAEQKRQALAPAKINNVPGRKAEDFQASERKPVVAVLGSKAVSGQKPVVKVDSVSHMKPVLAAPETLRRQGEELQRLLFYLNLTEEEAPLHLPLTLESPLLLNNPDVCRTLDGCDVHVLFLVHTAPNHTERRQDMRTTFMAPHRFEPLNFNVRVVFLLGRVSRSEEQAELEAEHEQHGDLVQGDFLDSYHNLSHKGVMGFRWVATYCPRARLLVKLDDDMFFDTLKLLLYYWPALQDKRRAILCNMSRARAKSAIIYRAGKWAVDGRLFRNETRYPYHYCTGNMVLMTGDLADSLYHAARRAPLFWVDDVYLYGMLPAVATDISYYFLGYGNRIMFRDSWRAMKCLEEKGAKCRLLGVIATGSQMGSLWDKTIALHKTWVSLKQAVRV